MVVEQDPGTPRSGEWDALIGELHAMRTSVGDPSFGEIARRIGEHRMEQGASQHAAHVAKSTVHDSFRMGRSRINLSLVKEIVRALGADESTVDQWLRQKAAASSAPSPAPEARPSEPAPVTRTQVVLLLSGCVVLNLLGRVTVDFLDLPIYLDMVGTAIAAIALGPWRGALVGGTTNVIGIIGSGLVSLPFALVNIAGALVWGYGIQKFRMGRSLPRFFLLNLLVAGVCTLLAVPLIVFVYGGSIGQGHDITDTFYDLTHTLLLAVGLSNILTSVADKLIAGFVALVVISSLPAVLRSGVPLLPASPNDRPDSRQ